MSSNRMNLVTKASRSIVDRLTSNPSINISNVDSLLAKVSSILLTANKEGNLGVITDFDRTITSGDSISAHGVVERCDVCQEHPDFRERTQANTDKVRGEEESHYIIY